MKSSVMAAVIGLFVIGTVLGTAPDAFAQQSDGLNAPSSLSGAGPARTAPLGSGDDPLSTTVTRGTPSRLTQQRRKSGVVTALPTAQEAIQASQSLANTARLDCRVAEATLRGLNAESQGVYEIACQNGPGYIIADTSPPQAADCITISGRTAKSSAAGAPAGPVCELARNQNTLAVLSGYAQAAGVDCQIDDAAWIGESTTGNAIYEIGCANAGGYWIERIAGRWTATDCVKVLAQNATCGFTTADERAATIRAWLAPSSASDCNVVDARYMGENPSGAFYEAKCSTGEGYVARLDQTRAVQQVYTCAEAANIGGGCKLAARL